MPTLVLTAAAGVFCTAVVVLSPLTACVLVLAPLAAYAVAGGLPADERKALLTVLGVAFAVRLAVIAGQLVAGTPLHSAAGVGALSGDESYYLSRALRTRDVITGMAATRYDFFVTQDEYGRTSYLSLLTLLQMAFGPTPYAMKALNALCFVTGAGILFRAARRAFGQVPAFTGLVILLCLPSLFVASISLLKESLYSLISAAFIVTVLSAVWHAGSRAWRAMSGALIMAATMLWLLNDLRRGALALALAGLGAAAIIRLVGGSRLRIMAAAAAAVVLVAGVLSQPVLRDRAVAAVATAAKMHAGHVFTIGHSYKLLDEDFYKFPEAPMAWDLTLTADQAARFLARGAVSAIVTPWPWELRSTSELAFMPELLLWYVLVAAFPIGVAAGWRLDPDAVSVFAGTVIVAAAVLGVTTGNVGTLLRLRGLLLPSMIWISALGLCAVAQWWLARRNSAVQWAAAPQEVRP